MKIAIIGAGVAGLGAAADLKGKGHDVRLFDKGRGAGGRLSTRRASSPVGELRFDHGAQFFTARDEGFRRLIERLETGGHVARWSPRGAEIAPGPDGWTTTMTTPEAADVWYVGAPSMNSIVKAMASGFDISWGERAVEIERRADGSHVRFDNAGRQGPFDAVILAIPAEQAGELLEDISPALADEAKAATTAPCWAVMLAFAAPLETGWEAARINKAPLSWAACNASKPGRSGAQTWVLHASPEWTREHVDMDKEDVAAALTDVFCEMTGAPRPVYLAAHRWLYAKTDVSAGSPFGWDDTRKIGVIGDWRIAPRVEAAWQSGHALATFLAD
ncbi:NAD(P)/FAD-dependent oxidoreductase [Henriciella marina]|uniref:NAD(P)/FAD-dependent oxidoreductase n=1 Tax=Henriciella marina TaxID=453851 RepID=UPI000380BB9E|nr:FAD-dependent oxidoreductase [Henriciella marina]